MTPMIPCLTDREEDVAAELLRDGATDKDIAARLTMSRWTAAQHVASVMRKMGAANRTDLA